MTRHSMPAYDAVMDILRPDLDSFGRERDRKIDFNRPHTYKWHEHKELPITDPNYFTIEVIYLDEEDNG